MAREGHPGASCAHTCPRGRWGWGRRAVSWKTPGPGGIGHFPGPSCCAQYPRETKEIVSAGPASPSHKIARVMQHPGVPAGTCPLGAAARRAETAGRRTFQIRAFSTELKNHVMVMDFVKSNWFPSQRRAKVCILRLYHGLKPAERGASRYEVPRAWAGSWGAGSGGTGLVRGHGGVGGAGGGVQQTDRSDAPSALIMSSFVWGFSPGAWKRHFRF